MNLQLQFGDELNDMIENVKGRKIRFFIQAHGLISRQEKPGLALRCFLERTDALRSLKDANEEDESIAQDLRWFEYRKGTLIAGILDSLISDGREEDDFYCALWNEIQESRYFEQEKDKGYMLYEIWTDGRIPYYKMPEGIQMKNEEFKEIIEKNLDQIKKIIFVLNSKYSQRTERSSLLIRILDSLETEEDKAVILAQILAVIDKRAFLRGVHRME